MTRTATVLLLLLACLPALAQEPAEAPSPAPAIEPDASAAVAEEPAAPERRFIGQKTAVLTTIQVAVDETVHGDVVCVGGTASVAGRVTGDVVVVGGTLELTGRAEGELVAVGSTVHFGPEARVQDDVVTVGSVVVDDGLEYGGQRINVIPVFGIPTARGAFGVFAAILGWLALLRVFLVFVVILAYLALAPRQVLELSERIRSGYVRALFVGLVAHAAMLVLSLLLAITVIGLPVLLVLAASFWLLRILGRAALFHAVGSGLGRGISREMSLVGATLLGFVPWALLVVLPLFFGIAGLVVALAVRMVLKLLVDCPAIGSVLEWLFEQRRTRGAAAVPPPPPAPPVVPMSA
jgi:hypothetical protein